MALGKRNRACKKPITKPKKPKSQRSSSVIINIDQFDNNDELAEVEYVEDLYTWYKEDQGCFADYMGSQPHLTTIMRSRLIDELIHVHHLLDLMPETLYLAINVVDRFLSVITVDTSDFQLVGIAALFVSSKYADILSSPLLVDDIIAATDCPYSRDEILVENIILTSLDWNLSVPTPYVFTVRYTKASPSSDHKQMEDMAFSFTKLALKDYWVALKTTPSELAASAVYAARCTLNMTPVWTETLQHYTGYTEDQLRDWALRLVNQHARANKNKLPPTSI